MTGPLLGEAVLEALCATSLHYSQCDEPNPADCARCVRIRENAKYTLAALEPLVAALMAEGVRNVRRELVAEIRLMRGQDVLDYRRLSSEFVLNVDFETRLPVTRMEVRWNPPAP